MSILAFILGLSFSASAANSTKYFKNPIKDDRVEFRTCAIEGAVYGVWQGKPESVACFGTLRDSTDKTDYIVFYDKSSRKTFYYEQTESKVTGGAGDDGAGVQEWTVKLRMLNKDLTPTRPARVGTWRITSEWMYSEGSTTVMGRVPGTNKAINYPLFNLENLDSEVDQLRGELRR